MAADVKKNPQSYLQHLEYKNKTRKIREEEEMKKNGHIVKREENFHLFFNGANDVRIRNSKKRTEFEQSKGPAARRQWTNGMEKVVERRRWEHPETPIMLKENKESLEGDVGRRSREEFEKGGYATKSTFKVAGNHLVRPVSKKDCQSLAYRIENLKEPQKDQILRMLEMMESDRYS